jgi:hypothetical protein
VLRRILAFRSVVDPFGPSNTRERGMAMFVRPMRWAFRISRAFPLYRVLQRLADEALVGNSRSGRRGPHRIEQLPGQAHVAAATKP